MEERSVTAALRTLLLIVCALLPALPARAEGAPDLRPEAAPRSRVLDVALPAGAIRLPNPAPVAETTARLAALAKTEGYQMNGNEVLFWGGPGYGPKRGEEIRTDLIGALREAGLHYRVGGEQNLDGVAMTLFFAMPEGQEQGAVGAWVDNGKILLLIWGNASRLEAKPAPSHGPAGATVPTAAAPARSNAGAIPSGLIGTWGFTTISGTTYWDSTTGAYLGAGTGGSQTYTFEKNGRYRMFNYVRSRTSGWQLETMTWEEGTYTVDGDQIRIRPTGGRYQVKDNRVARNNYTRPMRPEELKKNAKRYFWRLEPDPRTGKPSLMMGSTRDALVRYARPQ